MLPAGLTNMLLQRGGTSQQRLVQTFRLVQNSSILGGQSSTYTTLGEHGWDVANINPTGPQPQFFLPTTLASRTLTRGFASQAAALAAGATTSIPSISNDLALEQSDTGLIIQTHSKALTGSDVGSYYPFQTALVPEALQPFYQAFHAPRPSGSERKGGCKGLQAEMQHSKRPYIMYRECMHELLQQAQQPGARVMLQGAVGSGKSMAMVGLVEWARSNGWIVMYLPSATILTRGGYFLKRPDTHKYDTIISAQQLLKAMYDAHQAELQQLHQQLAGSDSTRGTLLDLIKKGLSADDDAATAVDSALALVSELALASEQHKVLFAVDDYNALYWRTDYGTAVPNKQHKRRELRVEELTLASKMRLLARKDLGKAAVVASVGCSIGVPAGITKQVVSNAVAGRGDELVVPRYSFTEVAHSVAWYHEAGVAADVPTEAQVRKLMILTSGNGREVRRMSCRTSLLDVNVL